MAGLLAIALLGVVFEDGELGALLIADHLRRDLHAGYMGLAHGHAVVIRHQQRRQLQLAPHFRIQFFDVDHVARGHAVLAPAYFDYCIHVFPFLKTCGLRVHARELRASGESDWVPAGISAGAKARQLYAAGCRRQ